MSHHEDTIRLRHMPDHAVKAVELTRGRRREDLDTDRTLNLALVRLMAIIGEASARVTPATQDAAIACYFAHSSGSGPVWLLSK